MVANKCQIAQNLLLRHKCSSLVEAEILISPAQKVTYDKGQILNGLQTHSSKRYRVNNEENRAPTNCSAKAKTIYH